MVTQFVSAFDDVIISRYNKQREEQNQLRVRYVYAPKQRVVHDLVNKNKHIKNITVVIGTEGISSVKLLSTVFISGDTFPADLLLVYYF